MFFFFFQKMSAAILQCRSTPNSSEKALKLRLFATTVTDYSGDY